MKILWRFVFAISMSAFSALLRDQSEAASIRHLSSPEGVHVIEITGTIEPGDGQKFANIALTAGDAIVVLSSDGGTLSDSLDIGRAIRIKKFATYIPDHSSCVSGCALIWLAGTSRYMSSSAKVGFHAAYSRTSGEITSSGNAVVGSYLNSLGLTDNAIYFLTAAAPTGMLWLTPAQAEKLGINVVIHDVETTASTTPPQPRTALSLQPGQTVPQGTASVSKSASPSVQLEREALSFVSHYVALEDSDTNTPPEFIAQYYEDSANYYGTRKSRKEIAVEYGKYVARWPIRKHALRAASTVISCPVEQPQCLVDAVIDWEVSSPGRNAKSKGVSTWHIVLSRDEGAFLISAVDGKVLERHLSKAKPEGLCLGPLCLPPAQE